MKATIIKELNHNEQRRAVYLRLYPSVQWLLCLPIAFASAWRMSSVPWWVDQCFFSQMTY